MWGIFHWVHSIWLISSHVVDSSNFNITPSSGNVFVHLKLPLYSLLHLKFPFPFKLAFTCIVPFTFVNALSLRATVVYTDISTYIFIFLCVHMNLSVYSHIYTQKNKYRDVYLILNTFICVYVKRGIEETNKNLEPFYQQWNRDEITISKYCFQFQHFD